MQRLSSPFSSQTLLFYLLSPLLLSCLQVVRLKEVFPHGTGFVLVFDFMLSDLSEVIRNTQRPLTQSQVKGYMMMLLKGVAFLHHNNIMHRVRVVTSSPSIDQSPRGCCSYAHYAHEFRLDRKGKRKWKQIQRMNVTK